MSTPQAPEWLGLYCGGPSMDAINKLLEAAAKHGFRTVQCAFHWSSYGQADFETLKKRLDALGLSCPAFGVYSDLLKGDRPAAEVFGTTDTELETAIRHSAILGAHDVVAWCGSVDDFIAPDPRNKSAESRERFQRQIDHFLPILQQYDCRLLFEPWQEHVIGDEQETAAICQQAPEHLGAVLDYPNFIAPKQWGQRRERMASIDAALDTHVGLVHLKDMTVTPEGGFTLPMFGQGDLTAELAEHVTPWVGRQPIVAEHLGADDIPKLLEAVAASFPKTT